MVALEVVDTIATLVWAFGALLRAAWSHVDDPNGVDQGTTQSHVVTSRWQKYWGVLLILYSLVTILSVCEYLMEQIECHGVAYQLRLAWCGLAWSVCVCMIVSRYRSGMGICGRTLDTRRVRPHTLDQPPSLPSLPQPSYETTIIQISPLDVRIHEALVSVVGEYIPLCTVCLVPFLVKDAAIRLRCNHVFHPHCCRNWFVGMQKTTCPNCRCDIGLALSDLTSILMTADSIGVASISVT